ncbi:MAG: hypothetical protein BGO55_10025 [Sphingobacteriales bacterium 50-39]|nr:hypothetical protein [Sphingobacteriales bacterium]OJW57876.1 MAG: hypothetical protein BGO55_10025 [Sphingobacteriales bacterium 50-39]
MTVNEKQLITDFVSGKITSDVFLSRYPIDFDNNHSYILLTLQNAYELRNAEEVDLGLSLLFFDKEFRNSKKYVEILCELLSASWHYRHEDIVTLLQGLKAPESVDALYEAALSRFDYLDYDDTYALARKCIHALGDIKTEYSKEKLRLLATSDVPIIKEKAEKQLYGK